MITQEELDHFLKEFVDEDPVLVNEALEECIKLYSRSIWNTASESFQVNSIFCWLAGWKHRDQVLFVLQEEGWVKKWEAGKTVTIPLDVTSCDKSKSVAAGGRILARKSQFDAFGASFLRNINGTPHAEIIVVPDDKYDEMTPTERMAFLNGSVIPEE